METIDLRGVCCPTNFVKAKLALEMADSGDVLEFYLDEGEPVQNVPRSLKAEGNKLLGLEKVDGYYVLSVEKA
ncbi:MAG: sulfurtransferase TusA family protein [Deltaproteobacteria bacterium]|nr:sulfurtransferase TusA family protein [Deltaproteobacteria bacterium]TLN00717.1 MAG: sulfurtransferase TusA family protein [bacterium]